MCFNFLLILQFRFNFQLNLLLFIGSFPTPQKENNLLLFSHLFMAQWHKNISIQSHFPVKNKKHLPVPFFSNPWMLNMFYFILGRELTDSQLFHSNLCRQQQIQCDSDFTQPIQQVLYNFIDMMIDRIQPVTSFGFVNHKHVLL